MKNLSLLFIIAASMILSCKNSETVTSDNNVELPNVEQAILAEDLAPYSNGNATTIESASIEGDILTINVNYSGGCEDHSFTLVGSKLVQKTLPPKRGIMLFHDGPQDDCRELIKKTLHFNISNLAFDGKETVLLLEGYRGELHYVPNN